MASIHDFERDTNWRGDVLEFAANNGGRKQRARGRSGGAASARRVSLVAKLILELWGAGIVESPLVQQLCHCVVEDIKVSGGKAPEILEHLASLGNTGKSPEHIKEGIVRYTSKLAPTIKPMVENIPLYIHTGTNAGPSLQPQGFLFPHLWLKHLYDNFRSTFIERFIGPPSRIQEFWDGIRADDPRRDHPVFRRAMSVLIIALLHTKLNQHVENGKIYPTTTSSSIVSSTIQSGVPTVSSVPFLWQFLVTGCPARTTL